MTTENQLLRDAVFTVLEGFTIPHDVRKILESAYYAALTHPTQPAEGGEAISRARRQGRSAHAAVRTLEVMGYTYHGGEVWKQPVDICPPELENYSRRLDCRTVEYLNHGTRFKVAGQPGGHGVIGGLPASLVGKWVALVDAEDGKHLLYTAPPASQEQAQQPSEPNCDRSACGDFSPGPCDHPDCHALRKQQPSGVEVVTRESALEAIEHVEQHNGPGRADEARRMLATPKPEPSDAVQVCPLKDSVCGDRPANWCDKCPKRKQQPSGEVVVGGQPADEKTRWIIRHNSDGEFGQATGWLYRDGGHPCSATGKPVYVWRPLQDLLAKTGHALTLATPKPEPMTPASARDMNKARKAASNDPDDLPEPWSYQTGWRAAEAHHGITKGAA